MRLIQHQNLGITSSAAASLTGLLSSWVVAE